SSLAGGIRERELLPCFWPRRLCRAGYQQLRRSTVGPAGGGDQLSHRSAGLWLRPGDCRVHILRARTAGHVDWDYASGIFWRDTAERSTRLLAAPATGDFIRRAECVYENEPAPVAVCHWQVEAGCERASTSRTAHASAPKVAP